MIPGPLVRVPCALCGDDGYEVLLSAREVSAELRYLRLFHRHRVRRAGPSHGGGGDGDNGGGGGDGDGDGALRDRDDLTQNYGTQIVACRGCGLVSRNPRPPIAVVTRAYAEDHYGDERLAALLAAHVAEYPAKAEALARWLPADRRPRLVEVGSFVGGFLAVAAARGWEVLGVDPGDEVDAFCRRRGLPVFRGTLGELPVEPGTLDGVAIWNTFDQLPDPEPTVAAARRLLAPDGVLALRVPSGAAFRQLCRCVRAALAWNNLLGFPYLHGYTPHTLDRLLARHRLERLAIHPDTLLPLADEHSRRWARWEERALKLACRSLGRFGPRAEEGGLAPWFDAYYRAV